MKQSEGVKGCLIHSGPVFVGLMPVPMADVEPMEVVNVPGRARFRFFSLLRGRQ
jgi:hypothetical protein